MTDRTIRTGTARVALTLLAVCLAWVLTLCLFAVPASALGLDGEYVTDRMGKLGEADLSALNELAERLSSETGVSFFVVVTRDRFYDDRDFMAETGLTEKDDFVLLTVTRGNNLIDDDEWHYDLYTWGKAARAITDGEVDRVLDHPDVYDNLKSGKIRAGLEAYLPYVARAVTSDLFRGARICGAVVCALAVSLGSVLFVRRRYTLRVKPTNYPLDRFASLRLTHSHETFLNRVVTSTVISSGSSGGGGGHSGGGGHRGGR